MHRSIIQMKHQLDVTLCRFYFCRVTLHVSAASAHHQEYLKLVQRPKHVEWPCRNKTCTVLHQVGVSFDLICCNICDTLHFDHTIYTCASVTMWRKSEILYLWHQYRSPVFTQFNQIKNPLIYITWQECAPLVKQTGVVVIANLILSCSREERPFVLQWN